MVFKSDWEKTDQRIRLSEQLMTEMVCLAFPSDRLKNFSIISGGCANLNVKVALNRDPNPYILRIYLRDRDAAYREQKIALLLQQDVPVPETVFIGDHKGYRFAIVEFIYGITLRDLLLGAEPFSLTEVMFEVGSYLAKIHEHEFESTGFFDNNLQLKNHEPCLDYTIFAEECLKHPLVNGQLGNSLAFKIRDYLRRLSSYFPDRSERSLVHADFDPANILVVKTQGKWKVSGILDWEFAFSGSNLCDVANMLRYAREMDPEFAVSFLEGAQSQGWKLPEKWEISVDMLNTFSLLDCLVHCDPDHRPNQLADIRKLILNISNRLDHVL